MIHMWTTLLSARIVTVTNSPAEAEVDFSMIPRNPVRPRASEVPTGTNESPTFDVMLQDTELSGQKSGMTVETLHLTIHSGTVTLVPAVVDTDLAEVPPDEIDYNAPTPVSRERVAEIPDFPMVDPSNSVTLRIPARQLRKWLTFLLESWYMTPGCRPQQWSSRFLQQLLRHEECRPRAALL